MPSYLLWSEYKEGLSFEAWMTRIFKTQGDSMAQDICLLAEPEKMKQDDEMVVAFSRREGRRRANCHMKPESASVVRLATRPANTGSNQVASWHDLPFAVVGWQSVLIRGPEWLRGGVHWQWKAFCESLQRLVAAIFGFVELEASASPSTKFVVGLEPVQPTSSDDIVEARCSCVDGSTFPEWLSTNCRGLDYRPVAPNTYFAEEEAIIHCLVHAAKAQLLTSLQHCQITEADVLIGQKDEEDPSMFQIAARLSCKDQ